MNLNKLKLHIEAMVGDEEKVEEVVTVAAGIIVKEDENGNPMVLLIQRAADDHWPLHFEFPRGKCDKGDGGKPRKCALREIKEETGLDVEIVSFLGKFIYYADKGKRKSICYNYECKMKNPNQKIKLSHEHEGYKWISQISEAELMVHPDQKRYIQKILSVENPIVSNPENDFTKNNTLDENLNEQYDDGMLKLEIIVRDPDYQLVKMIEHIRLLSSPGHSFEVIVDPDASKEEGKQSFGMDGDGSFYIKDIKLNGEKFKMKDGRVVESYLNQLQEQHPIHRRRAISKRMKGLREKMKKCSSSKDPQSCKDRYNKKLRDLQAKLDKLNNLRV